MNAKEAYESANVVLEEIAGQAPIEMPDQGTDHDKVQYLLDEYARRVKKKFWRCAPFRNNRRIPEMICQYLARMLTEDRRKPNQGAVDDGHRGGARSWRRVLVAAPEPRRWEPAGV